MDKNEHDINHDSKVSPTPECEWCAREVYRRTHRCFGDGGSSVPVPQKPTPVEGNKMAISIDWPSKVITVPKTFMSQTQVSPIEIRELDMDAFRLALKDLEDDADGMAWLDTHSHNAASTVGGVTLAMVILIINDYTITFEDGAYLVNIVGANNNVADRVNPNNVSVRSNNSAGLTVTTDVLATDLSSYNTAGTLGKIIKQIKSLVAAGL